MTTEQKICRKCNRAYQTEGDFLRETSGWRQCTEGHLWFECSCLSTLMIPRGKFSWYSPQKFMSPEATSIFNRLGGVKELPYIPSRVMRLLTLCDDPQVTGSKLAADVKFEPLIADEVFRVANHLRSQRVRGSKPFDALEHAIAYIGVVNLKDILLTASLRTLKLKTTKYDQKKFWSEAYTAATIAEHVARNFVKSVSADEAFLAGSLVNIGKLVAAICLPDQVDQLHEDTMDPKRTGPWDVLERKHVFVSHIVLGEVGGSLWGLSPYVLQSIASHHSIAHITEKRVRARDNKFYGLIAYANQMSHWILLQPERMNSDLLASLEKFLELTRKQSEQIAEEISKTVYQLS